MQAETHSRNYLAETVSILEQLDAEAIERVARLLARVREQGGRLFFIGSGGGAAHASHAAADFRKTGGFEAYSATDNVAELTARVNDEGWETSYVNWLKGSRLSSRDLVFALSVGGGDAERGVSANLVRCLEHAQEVGAAICGIVGRDGGFTARVANECVLVPTVNATTVTAHTEELQAVVWHLLISHPLVQAAPMRWESLSS